MVRILAFRTRRQRFLDSNVRITVPRRWRGQSGFLMLWLAIGAGAWWIHSASLPFSATAVAGVYFAKCIGYPSGTCVVDGDTFYYRGQSIRIADIDTPETYRARCISERRRGEHATRRLIDLLNAGPFELKRGSRDRDTYGRLLRTVHRDGRSLGAMLVAEGLARPWTGARRPWCF